MIKVRSLKAHNFKHLKEVRVKFPERGSVLVEGRNEAGKSTFFEAIYFGFFGDALVTEDNRNDLTDLIEYSSSMAVVELVLEVRDRLLRVTRTIHRDKPNQWRLSIFTPGGEEEQVNRNAAVDQRIIHEIGLDGDALLNSCFVEQKKLEKLEGLSAADRRRSLLRILNLEALEELEKQFRRRREDDWRLGELRDRHKLSLVLEEIPKRELEKAELERALILVEMKRALVSIEDRRHQISEARELIEKLIPERKELESRLEQIQRFKEGQVAADKIIVNLQRIAEWEREISEIEKRLRELDALEEALPVKEQRFKSLAVLSRHLRRSEQLREVSAEFERELSAIQNQLGEIEKLRSTAEECAQRIQPALQQIETDRAREAQLAAQVKLADQRDALEGWRRAKSTEEGISRVEADETAIREQITLDEKRLADERQRASASRGCMFGSTGSGLLVLVLGLVAWLGFGNPWLMGLATTGFVGLVYLTILHYTRMRLYTKNLLAINQALRGHSENLLRLEGQKTSLTQTGESGNGRVGYYEEILRGLETEVPASLNACEELLADLQSRLEGTDAAALRQELASLRENLAAQEASLREMESQRTRTLQELSRHNEPALNKKKSLLNERRTKVAEIDARWNPRIAARAESLGVAPELPAVRDAGVLLRNEIQRNRKEIAERAELEERIRARRSSVEELHTINAEIHSAIQAADEHAPDWTRQTTEEQYRKVSRYYASQVQELDEPGTSRSLQEVNRKSSAAQGSISTHEESIRKETLQLAEMCRSIGLVLPEGDVERKSLEERLPALKKAPEDDTALRQKRDNVSGLLVHLEAQRKELVTKLRLEGVDLVPAVCERELMDFERDLKVRLRAEQIVKQAREQLVSKVLPSTIEHMRRILPVLTMDRYHDAEITDDYKIRVWDERAGGWKAKNIFSGGTRDQFSLALRLAFALATLPQERGAAPGFIFLDEPLSSFDHERSLALMELITAGEIAEAFDQVFVISHSQVLDPGMFHHYLVLEDGRVVSSTLDALTDGELVLGSE